MPFRSTLCFSTLTTAGRLKKRGSGGILSGPSAAAPQDLLDFFQIDKDTGRPKGIVELVLDDKE